MNDQFDRRGQEDNERHKLKFGIERSILYHGSRVDHYCFLNYLTRTVALLLCGVVLMELSGAGPVLWAKCLAGAGALLTAFDLQIGFDASAQRHKLFKEQYSVLLRNFDGGVLLIAQARDRRLAIEAKEPPIFRALDLLCHNQLMKSKGYSRVGYQRYFAKVPWYRWITAQWIKWPNCGQQELS